MRTFFVGLLGVSLASGLGISLSPAAVAAPPPAPPAVQGEPASAGDELVGPLEQKRRALREKAVSDVASGRARTEQRNGSTVVKVGQTAGGGAFGKNPPTDRPTPMVTASPAESA